MNRFRRFSPIAVGVILGLGLVASVCATAVAADAPATAAAATQQQSNVTRATLKNGLRVVIVHDSLAPMVTTQITYLVGSYETPTAFPGTAHALEHMMFRDSKGLTGAQLNEMTGKMGAENNAFTTYDATQYFFVAPSQYVDMLLHIESLRMRGAELTSKGWDLEKGAIEQEVSGDISKPGYLAMREAENILYKGTAYAHDPLGSRPTFDATTGNVLQDFYNKWYQPNNAVLVIAGDVDPQATLAKVRELFGPIPKGEIPARAPVTLEPFKPQTISKSTPGATGKVEYLFRMPGQQSKDYAAFQVLLDALDNSRSSLSNLAAQGKVLSSGVGEQPFAHGGMGILQVGFPKGGDSKHAEAELNAVVTALQKNGVSPELVAAAKRQEQAQFEFAKNSANGLASAWSQALAWQGLDSPQQALDNILAVTPQDVNRVAREYLKTDQRITVVLTPNPDGKRPPNSQGFGGTESFASNDKLNVPLPAWATKQLATLQIPHWTLDPVTMKLANGITLIVQPAHVSKTITVYGRIDSNEHLQAPNGQEGVGQLLGSLFDYGTATLDRTAFHKALDEIAATESAGSSFHLAVPSRDFDRGMQLLADNELHPALPESGFAVQQKTLARTLEGELQSPGYKMMRAFVNGLYPAGDPALRHATPNTVGKLTLADAKAYFNEVYRPDMTTIVVVGDVTPASAKAKVEKYFGAWKAEGPKPDVIPKPVPLNPASYTAIPDVYASQDGVMMGQALQLNLHNPARYALQLGNEVLGGNGFASRLMLDVRVNHGYAYGASSGMQFGRSRSLFFVRYGSDSDKVKPVDGLVWKNIRGMRDTPVSAGELLNAKQARIRSIPLGVSSVNSIAVSLLDWSTNGEPLDEPVVAARHYLGMTAAEVQSAFKQFIHPDNLVQVVTGPVPKQH